MSTDFPTRDLGDIEVTAISDGYLQIGFGMLSNVDEDECETIQRKAKVNELNEVHINTFLVHRKGKNILIDSGAGGVKGWGGRLISNLARLDIQPEDIDAVLLTHAHPDHMGGLLSAKGEVVFAHAELIINSDEFNYLEDDESFAVVNDRVKGNFLLARSIFKKYQKSLRPIDNGEVFPGIFATPLKGHTPGHTGYRIEGSRDSLLIWGDIVHFPHIQLLKPEVAIAFDYDPHMAAETRSRILDVISSDRILVGGMHFGEQGFGYIEKRKSGYGIVNVE
ncbi:MBL fold metallo-hydrolase [Musicola paradisiaca]|uniref:Beta-lactamase domain protein n=1 Tax=Musicola paradisiaca (strain Ech703) TaxID=579405 RepID=C6CDU7_MUSP7|nr:MBL fold metallo-hydrolase [Musicola paradisiaca]ACS85214.1 beta-lactamase domain protein [Musicola paradisiaca Ech703]